SAPRLSLGANASCPADFPALRAWDVHLRQARGVRSRALAEGEDACLPPGGGQLVDLANEPDTTPWYSRRLRRTASALVGRLAPLTLFVHGANEQALEGGE